MAGDWIKMRVDLLDDPAVVTMAEMLGIEDYAVVGRLLKLWSWADRHSITGNAICVTEAFLDRYIGVTGWCNCMRTVGWLGGVDTELCFPNFDRHNGHSAKKRAETNLRVAEHRVKRKCNAKSVTEALPEKRREESNTPIVPKGTGGRIPTLEEWCEYAVKQGLPEWKAKEAWHYYDSNGWLRAGRQPITKWRSCVATVLLRFQEANPKKPSNGQLPRRSQVGEVT